MIGDAALNHLIDRYHAAMNWSLHNDEVVEIKVVRYLSTVLVITINDTEEKLHVFVNEVEQFGRDYSQEERLPMVAQMLRAGLKQVTIAKMLKTPATTINRDVRWLRVNRPDMLAGGKGKLRRLKTTNAIPKFSSMHREKKWE
jgi:hypothetical protein